jgi:hypothetical protein
MRTPLFPMLAIACLMVFCQATVNQGTAKLVRETTAHTKPAVDLGGLRLRKHWEPPVQYSVVGAMVQQSHWLDSCATTPAFSPLPSAFSSTSALPFLFTSWSPWRGSPRRFDRMNLPFFWIPR